MCNKDIKAIKRGSKTVSSEDDFKDANFVLVGLKTEKRQKSKHIFLRRTALETVVENTPTEWCLTSCDQAVPLHARCCLWLFSCLLIGLICSRGDDAAFLWKIIPTKNSFFFFPMLYLPRVLSPKWFDLSLFIGTTKAAKGPARTHSCCRASSQPETLQLWGDFYKKKTKEFKMSC